MEAMDDRERYISNPLRLMRCVQELAVFALRRIDDNLYDFPEPLPYNETNYPPCGPVDGPYPTELDLLR